MTKKKRTAHSFGCWYVWCKGVLCVCGFRWSSITHVQVARLLAVAYLVGAHLF